MKKRMLAGALAGLTLLSGCAGGKTEGVRRDFYAMDTFMTVTGYGGGADALLGEIETAVNDLDRALSRYRAESEIAALNAADGQAVTLSEGVYNAVAAAVSYAELTDGAYDPTTAPLSDLWGIGSEHPAVPEQAEIDAVLARVDWQDIELLDDQQVRLADGAQIDLGGIGKGWATDRTRALCTDEVPVLAQLGGNILGWGANPNSETGDWVIGVADPDDPAAPIATVSVQGESVVTSGDYERYFEQDGRRYHHIFDPKTGYPTDNGLRGVTVVDENSTRADALTTALFVMGLDEGMDFCEKNNVKALFVTADKKIYVTNALRSQYSFAGADAGYTDET